jgi:hypothetical protein
MKRPAFWSGPGVVFMLIASIVSAFTLERAKARFLTSLPVTRDIISAEASCLGMKYAEDWLLSSVASGEFPSARVNSLSENPLLRIEAVRSDGSSAASPAPGAEIYAADLDYEPGLFTGSLAKRADTLFIPRMPRYEDDFTERRFYYLRASVSAGRNMTSASEEVLSVEKDKATLNISAKRLLYRSGME